MPLYNIVQYGIKLTDDRGEWQLRACHEVNVNQKPGEEVKGVVGRELMCKSAHFCLLPVYSGKVLTTDQTLASYCRLFEPCAWPTVTWCS